MHMLCMLFWKQFDRWSVPSSIGSFCPFPAAFLHPQPNIHHPFLGHYTAFDSERLEYHPATRSPLLQAEAGYAHELELVVIQPSTLQPHEIENFPICPILFRGHMDGIGSQQWNIDRHDW